LSNSSYHLSTAAAAAAGPPWLCPAVGTGNVEGGLDFANMLKPALARSQLQVIYMFVALCYAVL
jgi:hypothetical protein